MKTEREIKLIQKLIAVGFTQWQANAIYEVICELTTEEDY